MTPYHEAERRAGDIGTHRTDDEFSRMASSSEWLGNKAQRTVRSRQSPQPRTIRPLAVALICVLVAIVLVGVLIFAATR